MYTRKMTDRQKYEFIYRLENLIGEFSVFTDEDFPLQKRLAITKDTKQDLRRRNKPIDFDKCDCEVFDDDGTSWIVKEWFDYVFNEDDIEEYVKSEWMCVDSWYDCTGETFTRFIKIFPLPKANKTIVYHGKGWDI